MKKLKNVSKIVIIVAVFLVAIVAIRFFNASKFATLPESDSKQPTIVSLESVDSLSKESTPLPLIGRVRSVNEANLRAESPGEISRVYVSLADNVSAGTIIAEIENSAERAAVLQAEAALRVARINFSSGNQVAGVSETISDLRIDQSNTSLASARTTALNSYQNAFVLADDAIRSKTDILFDAPRTGAPRLKISSTENIKIESDRAKIESILNNWENNLSNESANVLDLLDKAESDLLYIQSFLSEIAEAINKLTTTEQPRTSIDSWKALNFSARNNISNALSTVSSARFAYNNSLISNDIAKRNTQAENAQVSQAEAALLLAEANLEKKIIRTPVSGSVKVLNVKPGDYVSSFEQVALVSSPGSLEIVASVAERDRRDVVVGAPVIIDGQWFGVVSSVASGIDEATRKVEVIVAVNDPEANLLSGQSVSLSVERGPSPEGSTASREIILPISALKVSPTGTLVFTVSGDGKLVAHEVSTGSILGNKIIILDGVNPEMQIVVDARGLKEGQEVMVK